VYLVKKTALMIASLVFAAAPLLSKPQHAKPSFEVVSIKPSPPDLMIRGGGPRGDRFAMSGASLRMLIGIAYQPNSGQPGPQIQIIGGPGWLDSDRYEIQAKADCSAGPISRQDMQLMVQSMLEDRFQLKAHFETRELPIYNLVVGRDGPKLKASADQTVPTPVTGGPPQLCGPAPNLPQPPLPPPPGPGQRGAFPDPSTMPRGAVMMMMSPTGMTMMVNSAPLINLVNQVQQFVGRPVVDKTGLKGLFDIQLQFSREGLTLPGAPGGIGPGPGPGLGPGPGGADAGAAVAADPIPSLFTAIQELGLRLESARGPVEVLVIDGAEKPAGN
jgi:uncharacterized protein (TIGR03435 family)